jgi:hypothetical protein
MASGPGRTCATGSLGRRVTRTPPGTAGSDCRTQNCRMSRTMVWEWRGWLNSRGCTGQPSRPGSVGGGIVGSPVLSDEELAPAAHVPGRDQPGRGDPLLRHDRRPHQAPGKAAGRRTSSAWPRNSHLALARVRPRRPHAAPTSAVARLADQLQVSPDGVARYGQRDQTRTGLTPGFRTSVAST